ncbi:MULTISPECIES: flagellar filament capping protein FliD [Citrobacter]|uniref:flagellar filament capping protein FliD n=1 Tax=Citrobacter TaxID=544 RepID=UPI000D7CCEA8|nr:MULTISPECIES: flagellar filament capping protein FliD [Citrobacter]MDE9577793.1 flagellar filament capping protein FliD [Citrobacter koseri]MDM2968355.1 flagellar filament capping protein FliD [Citrobacter sp. CK199]MDM2977824.1 flagellar filament capping protein FliD [Citrobacter sp. CK200]PYZ78388.1 flagellar filament capping protein FliD [Citrobacter koseri]HAV2023732.1 flagellar filament capping protein FliD [Citrobacter koseri]
MASISSLGVGSNLPLDTLLTNLTTAEKGRLTPITKQQSANTAKLTAYGTLKSALEKFQTANTALNKADLFKTTTASSTSEDLKVSTTAGAAPGTYKINVTQLAAAQSLATDATFATTKEQLGDTSVSSRTIKIEQPGRKEPLEIKLDKGDTSMEAVRDAINDADSGISASIVKVSEDKYQLVLTADSGTDNTMKISVEGDTKLNELLAYDSTTGTGNMKELVKAQNAELNVNGIDIVRQSNTVTDAPQGLTLNLTKTVNDVTVTVTKDDSKATEAIKTWVDAYNSLVDTFSTLTKYTEVEPGEEASDKNGALLGDSVLRTIQTGIRSPFANSGSDSSFKTIAEIGITQDGTTGKLKIDEEKLAKALKENTASTRELLVGDGKETGITTKIATEVKSYLADDGIIDNAQDNINATLKNLTKQYLSVSNSIDETVARYKAQFTQLDTMMSKLNSTSSYLSQQFAAMSNS